jgi:hypothetical protein
MLRIADHAQRTVADEAGTHQRRSLQSRVVIRKRKAVVGVCNGDMAAVDLIACERRQVAQVLMA